MPVTPAGPAQLPRVGQPLVFTCCQAIWPFHGFLNVGNKRLLEPKFEMDANIANLANRLAAVESRAKFEESNAKLKKESQESRANTAKLEKESQEFREKFAVFEKEFLKVTATNRNFRLFAERFAQQRETPNCQK